MKTARIYASCFVTIVISVSSGCGTDFEDYGILSAAECGGEPDERSSSKNERVSGKSKNEQSYKSQDKARYEEKKNAAKGDQAEKEFALGGEGEESNSDCGGSPVDDEAG